MTRARDSDAVALWEAMVSTPFPYALIDPLNHVYLDGNREYAALLGIDVADLPGLKVLSLCDGDVRKRVASLMASFATGGLYKTQGRAPSRTPGRGVVHLKGWSRRIDGLAERPLVVTSAVEADSKLEPDDHAWVRRAPHVFGLRDHLSPHPPQEAEARAAQLEQHLWRIGLEVHAAGLLPFPGETGGADLIDRLHELSDRQRAIVSRLLAGERVAEIATSMYLSPSTVRNHLTAVFRRFGVHSQVELIALLRKSPTQEP